MRQGKRRQGQRRAKIWIPKEKAVLLAKMGEPEEGIGFKTDKKYGVSVKLEMIWGKSKV